MANWFQTIAEKAFSKTSDKTVNKSLQPQTRSIDINYETGEIFHNHFISGNYQYERKNLQEAVEIGFNQNPVVFGVANRISFASKNLKLLPYRSGKEIKTKTINFDIQKAVINLITTGTVIINEFERVGFTGKEYEVLDTLCIHEEFLQNNQFRYSYLRNGKYYPLKNENLLFITLYKIPNEITQLGLSPLQVAGMSLESIKEMYIADTSLLKNKGAEGMISGDSEDRPLTVGSDEFDNEINNRVRGARKAGSLLTTTAIVKYTQMGRSIKELALWDGYKVKVRDIANALMVDSSVFNDPDNKKFSNVTEAQKAFYTECVIPLVKHIVENTELVRRIGYEIFVDSSSIECLQKSQKEKAEKNKLVTDLIISLNEKVNSKSITKEIAIRILNQEWGYDIEEASLLINVNEIKQETNESEE